MRLNWHILSFFIAINFLGIFCQQNISLIGSRYASIDSKYKTYLLQDGADANVIVEFDKQRVDDQLSFGEIAFDVQNDVPKYEIKLSSTINNVCKQQSVNILNIAHSPIVLVQFNKPIYRTNESFKFRVFILTRKLLPIPNFGPIDVHIKDSDNNDVVRFQSDRKTNQFGVYEEDINIRDLQNYKPGVWTIEVKAKDRKVTKTFEVQDSNDGAEVFVEAPSTVAFVDRKVYLNIYTKDSFGRSAEIYLKASFVNLTRVEINKHVKSVRLTDLKTSVSLDFQEDLDIKYPTADINLSFTIQISGPNPSTVMKNIIMKYKGRNTITTIKKKYFKPGFKFQVKVRVKVLDGKPDNSLNQLSTTIQYVSKLQNGQNEPKIDKKTFQTNLKNGETFHHLQPKADTDKIILSFEFADTKLTEVIERFPGAEEYMMITMLTKNTTVGSTVQMRVQSTEEMELPRLLVFGTKGIIQSQTFNDSVGKDVFEFSLELTDEMRPEAHGLVFYTRDADGAMVYDEFSIKIGFSINNSLEISAPELVKANEIVDITVKTEEGSQVFIIATDVNSALFSYENEISRISVYNELVYHLIKKFEPTSDYYFEKLNAFILDPLRNGSDCTFSSRSAVGDYDDVQQNTNIDKTPHKYFPEALLEIAYVATTNENETIQIKFPDSTTTWKFYGISVHPEKGFTVAKTQPEVSVKAVQKVEKLQLMLRGPQSINQGEVHDLHIIVTNELRTNLKATVVVNIEDGFFIKEVPFGNQNCREHKKSSYEEFELQFTPEKHAPYRTLRVTSNNEKSIKITATVTATTGRAKDEASTEIQVRKNVNDLVKKSLRNELIDITNANPRFETILKTSATIYGNILGPAVDGLEKILLRTMILDEDKALKFGTEVVIYKFLKNTGLQSSEKGTIVLNNIMNYYQEVAQILQDIIHKNDSTKIWLAALITDIILDLQDLRTSIPIEIQLIADSLNFIKQQYINNRSMFPYDADSDIRRDISSKFRETIQTALITKVVLRSNVQEFLNFFSSKLGNLHDNRQAYAGDHIIAVAAYVLAYHSQNDKAKTVLAKMAHGYTKKITYPHHFTMYVEIISYEILTKIMLNQDPREQVQALLKYRNADAAFYSPFDTYLALKALSEYSRYRNIRESAFVFYLNDEYNSIGQLQSRTVDVKTRNQKLTIGHKELGYVNVFGDGNDKPAVKKASFDLKDLKVSKVGEFMMNIYIKFSYIFTQGTISNLVVLEVDIPEGYQFSEFSDDYDVVSSELRGDQKLILYINKVQKGVDFWKSIRLIEKTDGTKFYKPLFIKIYDYYRPNIKDVFSYDLLCV
ncbi:unnamed protein product [Chironomus riparius]|uniref:Uncharacterized protein n=1 Tax=Chironomus riparius TaxID=315576 RepID=A0A9N9S4L1_9DIPT|nr:unnamed protein product [Chironomus riparius]